MYKNSNSWSRYISGPTHSNEKQQIQVMKFINWTLIPGDAHLEITQKNYIDIGNSFGE